MKAMACAMCAFDVDEKSASVDLEWVGIMPLIPLDTNVAFLLINSKIKK